MTILADPEQEAMLEKIINDNRIMLEAILQSYK